MRITATALGLVIAFAAIIHAQSAPTDEQQIRAQITKYESGQTQGMFTSDRIFWSGATKKPTVGTQRAEEVPSDRRISDRVPGSQRSKTTPIRIEVAKSGDLAYEFSDNELSFDLKNGKKESFPASILRVWKKEAGQWKIAAQFSRPHYEEATR